MEKEIEFETEIEKDRDKFLEGKKVGICFTGSFCTMSQVIEAVKNLKDAGADLLPVVSPAIDNFDTKFGEAEKWKREIATICGKELINTIPKAEPIGPGKLLDILVVCPCSGNTLAKLANGITDTPVLMGIKAHLRNDRPVVLAIATNDGLGINGKNIGLLLNSKNIFFVPFGQDSPSKKPNSLMADFSLVNETVKLALTKTQIQPVLIKK